MDAVNRFQWEKAVLSSKMNADSKVIALAYGTYGTDKPEEIWPGIKEVVELTGYSKDKVQKTRAALIQAGWLTPSGNYTPNGGDKLYMTIGQEEPEGYLAAGKRRVNPKSLSNLKPGARHLSGNSKDSGTGTLSGYSRGTSPDNREDLSGKSREEVIEYQDRTTKNNQSEELLSEQPSKPTAQTKEMKPEVIDWSTFDTYIKDSEPFFEEKEVSVPLVNEKKTRLPAFAKNKEVLAEARAKKETRAAAEVQQKEWEDRLAKSQNETAKWTEGFSKEERETFRRYTSMLGNGPKLSSEKARERIIEERSWDQW